MPIPIPTQAQIAKLPVWAQEHIKHLQNERDSAVKKLIEFTDEQTPSGVFIQDHVCINEGTHGLEPDPAKKGGPTFMRRYLQTNRVQFALPRSEMEMEVYVNDEEQRVEIRAPKGYPYIEPINGNSFYLVPKEDMYLHPNATTLCQAFCDAEKLSFDAFVRKYGFSREALSEKMKSVVPKSHWKRTVHG